MTFDIDAIFDTSFLSLIVNNKKMNLITKNTYLSPRDTEKPQHFPSVSEPKIVGAFSIDGQRRYLSDRRNCKYLYKHFHPESVQYDLNEGIESVIRKPDLCSQEEKINHLLHFISENIKSLRENNENPNTKFLSADVVCFRGLLRLLMCTPYEFRESWIVLATKYKGTIYLCAKETDKKVDERLNQTANMKTILSYGFKFEQFLLTGKLQLNNNQRYKLTNFLIIYSYYR